MNLIETLAEVIGNLLLGWIAKRRVARQKQALQNRVTHDEQVIVNQKQTIQVEQARDEIERQDGTLSQKPAPDLATAPADSIDGQLRDIGAIRKE